MPVADEIITLIDERLAQAREELTRLQGARDALADSAARRRAAPLKTDRRHSPAAPGRDTARGRRTRRRPRQARRTVDGDLLASTVGSASEPLSTAQMAMTLDVAPARILPGLRELEVAQRIRRCGAGRGSRWHAVTDEDRIAQRAAELAALA